MKINILLILEDDLKDDMDIISKYFMEVFLEILRRWIKNLN